MIRDCCVLVWSREDHPVGYGAERLDAWYGPFTSDEATAFLRDLGLRPGQRGETRRSVTLAAEGPPSDVEVVLRVRMSVEKLDAHVRGLYDEGEDAPTGIEMVREWVAETQGQLDDPSRWAGPDLVWMNGEYVEGVEVVLVEGPRCRNAS